MNSTLFLMPLTISESESRTWIGSGYHEVLKATTLYFVENIRTARRFISSLRLGITIDQLQFEVLDKDTSADQLKQYALLISQAEQSVVMSESGCPGIADPGSQLVNEAHKLGVSVVPFVGPSSLVLALMASGLNGQNFCFHGYLPVASDERNRAIIALEKESRINSRTQLFIETPYRNNAIWKSCLEILNPETRLCIAFDILGADQRIQQKKVKEWKTLPQSEWGKKPAVFLFLA
jgi:16S rRNA (cytidine1402-2'-O)-methyltransferase